MSEHYDGPAVACGECGSPMTLRSGRFGRFYGCTRWPECGGVHGAHPDGSPMGEPADQATRHARIAAHAAFDQLWQSGRMTRKAAYSWLARTTNLTPSSAHIAKMDRAQCEAVVAAAGATQGGAR